MGLAVILGLTTVALFSHEQHATPLKTISKTETDTIIVPLIMIHQGDVVSQAQIATVLWPRNLLPKDPAGQFTAFHNSSDVVGHTALEDLFPNEPLFPPMLSGKDSNGGFTAIIPKGMRAVTIAVTEVKGVAGFVKPGDHVDVLGTFEAGHDSGQTSRKTKTVLQDVRVLASAQSMTNNLMTENTSNNVPAAKKTSGLGMPLSSVASTVTLALTPEQAQTMALTEEAGEVRLALRSDSDHGLLKLAGLDINKLIGKAASQEGHAVMNQPMPAAPPLMPPPIMPMLGTQVELIQGNEKTLYNF